MRKHLIAPVTGIVLLAIAGSANALIRQTTFGVTASVGANCLVSAADLAFGTYTGTAALTSSSDVTVRCTNGTPYTVALSTGSGTYAARLLASGGNNLRYNLYTSIAYTSIWGDGTASTALVTGTGAGMALGSAVTHTVYGQLPDNAANEAAPVGSYADTITVTVEY